MIYKIQTVSTGSRWLRNTSRSSCALEDERALEILKRKTEDVSYPLGETEEYQDQSKDTLNSILNEDVLSDI